MRVLSKIGYLTLAFFAIVIALASFRFLTFNAEVLAEALRPNLIDHPIAFYLHTSFAPIALLLGVWQFLPVTRRSAWHRWAGRAYVIAVLIASVSGFLVAFTTAAGPIAATGFAILAILCFAATLMAYLKVRAGRIAEHRRWMIRSYALTCSAISLRLILPTGIVSGLDFLTSYTIAAWGSWVINLLIAEAIIRARSQPANIPVNRSPNATTG